MWYNISQGGIFMITLENDYVLVELNPLGVQIQRIFDKKEGIDLISKRDDNDWKATAPIMFPIVGDVREKVAKFLTEEFELDTNGFVRKCEFDVVVQTDTNAVLKFSSIDNAITEQYPFDFSFYVEVTLEKNEILMNFAIENNSEYTLSYGLGHTPIFNLSHPSRLKLDLRNVDTYFKLKDGLVTESFDQRLGFISFEEALHETPGDEKALCFESSHGLDFIVDNYKIQYKFHEDFKYIIIETKESRNYASAIQSCVTLPDSYKSHKYINRKENLHLLDERDSIEHSYSIVLLGKGEDVKFK